MSRGSRRPPGPASCVLSPESSIARRTQHAGRRTLLALLLFAALACRQKMANQPKYDPLEPSDFFADGMSARPRIPGTVARGELDIYSFMATGKINGADGDGFPMPVTAQVMNRGEERFNI